MSGRYTLQASPEVIAKTFDLQELPDIEPHYNIAPGQRIAAVRHIGDRNRLDFLAWGLQPGGSQDTTPAPIIAHSETVHEEPLFMHAVTYNRCIIPASGFYEWLPGKGDHTQPYYIRLCNSGLMGFAGLWEKSKTEDGSEVETCCVLTTSANETVQPIHDRMPVILSPDEYGFWLNRHAQDPRELQRLYRPYPSDLMVSHPVPELVNIPRFDSAACIVHM